MDSETQARLAEVHPELARRVTKLYEQCETHSLPIRVTCGLRTYDEQNQLFDEGRTIPGNIVTDAKGGFSAHQFGYAVDVVPGREGFPDFVPDWDSMDTEWKMILNFAIACELAEGASWRAFPDRPHLYLSELPATPTEEMRAAMENGGIQAVWKLFQDAYNVPMPPDASVSV